jgi:hypothetical protein
MLKRIDNRYNNEVSEVYIGFSEGSYYQLKADQLEVDRLGKIIVSLQEERDIWTEEAVKNKKRIKELEAINESHRKLNGELRVKTYKPQINCGTCNAKKESNGS